MTLKRLGRNLLSLSALMCLAQLPSSGQDKPGVWTLDVKFESPNTTTVTIPGRGDRTVWYLVYEVSNNTKEPRHFIPTFHLLADKPAKEMPDEILPVVQDKLRAGLKNSITVSTTPIPAGGKIQAVAIWDGIDPTATLFTVYLRGLSNGLDIQNKMIRYKTLQVNFKRDAKAKDIRPSSAQEWIYREKTIEKS
jgi:hypothetical protein